MRAATFSEYSGPGAVQVTERPVPEPGPGEVRIRVRAAGLNNSDLQTTRGGYGRPALPHTIGQEAAGEIDALGEGVAGFAIGDRVIGRTRHACAELALAQASDLIPLPAGISYEVGASLPIAYLTCGMALVQKANTQSGEWVLVQSASGGVGTAAVQLAKLLGAKVIATAGSPAKLDRLAALGADHGIDYTTQKVPEEVWKITGNGVQVAVDGGGITTLPACLESVANNGRVVTYGTMTGLDGPLSLRYLILRNIALWGIAIWTNADYQASLATVRDVVLPAVADGRIKAAIDHTVGLDGVSKALQAIEDRAIVGKIVVVP